MTWRERATQINPLMPAVVKQESGGNPNALSPKGAAGKYQIMPATARDPGYGVQPLANWDGLDPRTAPLAEQERFANDYLNAMQKVNGGNPELALAAYNAGPGAVQKHGGIPPYQETRNYVSNIMNDASGQVASNDWRSRAQPVQNSGWRERATPIQAQPPTTPQPTQAPTKPSSISDVLLTTGSNLAKGGVDAAMILPNLLNEAVAGPQYLYEGLIGEDRKDFQPYKPFLSSEDIVSDSYIDYKPQTTAGKIAEIPVRLVGNLIAPSVINKGGNKVFPGKRPTAGEVKARSQLKYNEVERSGATLDDQVYSEFLNKANNIRPKGRIAAASEMRDAFDDALDVATKVSSVKNMSINEVKQFDEQLTNLAEKARGLGGKSTPESRLINELKHTWREVVEESADKGLVTVKSKPNTAFDTTDDYVYHITPKDDFRTDSFAKKGILPSKDGYSGQGVYMANTPDKTLGYTISKLDEGELLRVNKNALIEKFGKYPQNKNGVQFDNSTGEVILPGNRNVPPEFIELKTASGWKPLSDKPYTPKNTADPKIVDTWKSAIKDYASASRAKDLEIMLERAKLRDVPASAIKTRFGNYYEKILSGKIRGHTKQEIAAIKKAADTGVTTYIARIVSSRLNPIIALSSAGVDAGITAGAAAKAAEKIATNNQVKRAEKVLELLLGEPVKNPITASWAARNQSAARMAAPSNLASQLMAPSKETKK